MMGVADLAAFADAHHSGDRAEAVVTISRAQPPYEFSAMPHDGTVKSFVAHWAGSLSRRLPSGTTVNAVSPGVTRGTSMAKNLSFFMRVMMNFVMRFIAPLFGASTTAKTASMRYVDALGWGPERNGEFHASLQGKMTGKLVQQTNPHIVDRKNQDAVWQAVVELGGGTDIVRPTLEVAPAIAVG